MKTRMVSSVVASAALLFAQSSFAVAPPSSEKEIVSAPISVVHEVVPDLPTILPSDCL